VKVLILRSFFLVMVSLIIGPLHSFAQKDLDEMLSAGIKTVVIDPGHGGKDPGCLGKHTKEKEVCLAIGLKLGKYIEEKYPHIKVVYTRKTDIFLELDERAKIANQNNADLFICIHANSAGPSAYGAETYVLGLHRTESQQKVAERENSIIHFEDNVEKYKDFDLSPDAIIARQLQLAVYLDMSINFASKVQSQFKSIGRHDRGVKQAGFLVLYKTTMPSVLIELGFLTNEAEEKFLKDTLNQMKMANSIFRAFQEYKSEIEGVNELLVDAKSYKDALSKQSTKPDKEEKPAPPKPSPVDKNTLVFKVQVETSRSKIPPSDARFRGLSVDEYLQDGLYKYTDGNFVYDLEAAKAHREKMVEMGFQHAFVVAFKGTERISMEEAYKMLREKK
jgi:N-acetylmuramoyl-L-alanine amidase